MILFLRRSVALVRKDLSEIKSLDVGPVNEIDLRSKSMNWTVRRVIDC